MLCSSCCGQCRCPFPLLFCNLGAGFGAIADVAGLKVAVAGGEPIKEHGGHLGVTNGRRPFSHPLSIGTAIGIAES